MSISAEQFANGMTFAEYMAQMGDNKEPFAANYTAVVLTPDIQAAICGIGVPLNVLVITEDWCGDALTYLPVLGRLAACAGNWNLRVFLRDQNLALADQFLNFGKWRSVPVVVFYDQAMREVGRFIERPASVNRERQVVIDAIARENPAVQAGQPYNAQSEEGKAAVVPALRELRHERKAAWQQAAIGDVLAALARIEAAA